MDMFGDSLQRYAWLATAAIIAASVIVAYIIFGYLEIWKPYAAGGP